MSATNISLIPRAVPWAHFWRGAALSGRLRTYISAFSNRFFKFSLMASLDTLLISVRSETPTSFFLVLSNTAFAANPPPAAGLEPPPSFLRPARLLTAFGAYQKPSQCMRLPQRARGVSTMTDARECAQIPVTEASTVSERYR